MIKKLSFGGFFDFMVQANVMGLALGLMLGNAVTELTGHLIDDIIFPLIKPWFDLSNIAKKMNGKNGVNVENFTKSFMKFSIIIILVGLLVKILGMSLSPPIMDVAIVKGKR